MIRSYSIILVSLLALQLADLLRANDLKRYGELTEDNDGFLKLCALEHLTRVEYKRQLGEQVAGLLLEDYFELTRKRQELGKKLLQFYCPVGFWSLIKDCAVNVAKVRAIFDKKCAKENASQEICSQFQQSRELLTVDEDSSAPNFEFEHWICGQYIRHRNDRLFFARTQRKEAALIYGATRPDLINCSAGIMQAAQEEARKAYEEVKDYSIEQFDIFKKVAKETEDAELSASNQQTANTFEELNSKAKVVVDRMKSLVEKIGPKREAQFWIKE